MMHHRSWFPFILIGLSLTLFLVILVWFRPIEERIVIVTEDQAIPIEQVDYRSDVADTLRQFQTNQDVEEMRDRLLGQRVPSEYKEIHFELILVVGIYRAGNVVEAEARLAELRVDDTWLP